MRTLIVVGLLAIACGGGSSQTVPNPSGTWTLTDTLREGSCAPSAAVTLTVAQTGNSITMAEGGAQYAIDSSWCDSNVCEARGTLDGFRRDVQFQADGTLAGNRSKASCTTTCASPDQCVTACVTDCAYSTAGHR